MKRYFTILGFWALISPFTHATPFIVNEPTQLAMHALVYTDYTRAWVNFKKQNIDRRSIIKMSTLSDVFLQKYPSKRSQMIDQWLELVESEEVNNVYRQTQIIQLARLWSVKYNFADKEFRCVLSLAGYANHLGQYKKARKYFNRCKDLLSNISSKSKQLAFWNAFGTFCFERAYYLEAGRAFNRCAELARSQSNNHELAIALSNMGSVYAHFDDPEQAKLYYGKSYSIRRTINDKEGMLTCFNNLGSIYKKLNELDSAEHYLELALALAINLQDTVSQGIAHCNLGAVYLGRRSLVECEKEILKAKRIFLEFSMDDWLGYTSLHEYDLNLILEKNHRHNKVLLYKVYETALAEKNADLELRCLERLSLLAEKEQKWNDALRFHQEEQHLRDSLQNFKAEKALIKLELEQEIDKEKRKVGQSFEQKLSNERQQREKQENWTYSIAGGLFFAIGFGMYFRRQTMLIRIQRKQILNQHKHLEESHKDVQDSIAYAQKIQSAILPFVEDVEEVFPNSFMIYRPKDVVAGDFYWIQKVENGHLFAVADCTGHGVPGALVSVVCINALNRCVREFGLEDPGEILSKTRDIIIEEFEQAHVDLKDGMDIALCKLHDLQIDYAGANNPLWLIRGKRLMEFKPSKQPIGKFIHPKAFVTQSIQLNHGDKLYLFSDGAVDLFGGPKNKKLKKSGLKNWLYETIHLPMSKQGENIDQLMNQWVQNGEQIDDICLMGMEVK